MQLALASCTTWASSSRNSLHPVPPSFLPPPFLAGLPTHPIRVTMTGIYNRTFLFNHTTLKFCSHTSRASLAMKVWKAHSVECRGYSYCTH